MDAGYALEPAADHREPVLHCKGKDERREMKEVLNHIRHIEITFDRLVGLLYSEEELDAAIAERALAAKLIDVRRKWIKTSDLVVKGITTEKMVLIHLLWLQKVGTVIVEDVDPYSGAVLIGTGVEVAPGKKFSQA